MVKIIPSNNQQRELGFGKFVTTEGRLMNVDGSFNVKRHRAGLFDNLYYHLVTMASWKFAGLTFIAFGILNSLFALVYVLIGVDQFGGMEVGDTWHNYRSAYFFSSQTMTTVGYGHVYPKGLAINLVASVESFMGLLTFALISGLLYGRFSRPGARVIFSENMLVAPYRDGQALMFRMVNARRSEMLETEVQVTVSINQMDEVSGLMARRFFNLDLELSRITFFSMSWTIVHAITDKSPLWSFSQQDMNNGFAEYMVMVKGTDEATEQVVHARRSYIADEVVWNAKFKPIMERTPDKQKNVIHSKRVGDHEILGNTN
jgi:inward rectifier potassium channel